MNGYITHYISKNILITGGAGCIGSNLAKALIKANPAKIIILDDLSSSEKWNIPVDPSILFIKGSIVNDDVLKNLEAVLEDILRKLTSH